jgi:hypothetical protein
VNPVSQGSALWRAAPMSPVLQGSALRRIPDPAASKIQFNGGAELRRYVRVSTPDSCSRDCRPNRYTLSVLQIARRATAMQGSALRQASPVNPVFAGVCPVKRLRDEPGYAGVCPVAGLPDEPGFAGVCPVARRLNEPGFAGVCPTANPRSRRHEVPSRWGRVATVILSAKAAPGSCARDWRHPMRHAERVVCFPGSTAST